MQNTYFVSQGKRLAILYNFIINNFHYIHQGFGFDTP